MFCKSHSKEKGVLIIVKNIILAGVGGQGTVLASKLIAQAAINKGLNARTAETIGMAQRGGCVVSHVRIGEIIHSPMISKGGADVIIGFEPAEAVRCLPYLKSDGMVIVCSKAVMPVTSSLGNTDYNGEDMINYLRGNKIKTITVNGEEVEKDCGTAKVLNVALLGAAAEYHALGLSIQEIEEAISQRVNNKYIELNKKALLIGAKKGQLL